MVNSMWIKRLVTGAFVIGLLVGVLPVLAQDGEELTETFTNSDGSLTLNYPSGWYAEEYQLPGLVFIGTNTGVVEAMLGDEYAELESGDLMITITTPQVASTLLFEGETPKTLEDALEMMEDSSGDDSEFGEPEALTLAGHPALLANATQPFGDGVGMVIDFDGSFVVSTAVAMAGEYGNYADTVLAILDTLMYIMPQGIMWYEDAGLNFEYPAVWLAYKLDGCCYVIGDGFTSGIRSASRDNKIFIYIIRVDEFATLFEYEALRTATMEQLVLIFSIFPFDDGTMVTKNEPEPAVVGEREGVKLSFSTTETDPANEGFVLALPFEDTTLVVLVLSQAGELAGFEADVMAVIESLDYTSAE